jgi:hypothetical protein
MHRLRVMPKYPGGAEVTQPMPRFIFGFPEPVYQSGNCVYSKACAGWNGTRGLGENRDDLSQLAQRRLANRNVPCSSHGSAMSTAQCRRCSAASACFGMSPEKAGVVAPVLRYHDMRSGRLLWHRMRVLQLLAMMPLCIAVLAGRVCAGAHTVSQTGSMLQFAVSPLACNAFRIFVFPN